MKGFLRQCLIVALCLSCASRTQQEPQRTVASIDDIPVIGATVNTGILLADSIYGTAKKINNLGGSVALFTVGNIALDSYILTLPMEKAIKTRVIKRISNYSYATKLSTFLMAIKNQYTGESLVKDFDSYISTKYSSDSYRGLNHGLFKFNAKAIKKEASGAKKSFLNSKLIAKFVTFYDAIYGAEENSNVLKDMTNAPYEYLRNNKKDLLIVETVQNLVVELVQELVKSIPEISKSDMVKMIIEDAKPENKNKRNNKAQAATISLIDFVRMMVHKNYNAHIMREKRIIALQDWMLKLLEENPHQLIGYLKYLNQDKKFAVQIAVDGLQGHLMEALIQPKKSKFIDQIRKEQFNLNQYAPKKVKTIGPSLPHGKSAFSYDFLKDLKSGKADSDPNYLPYFKKMFKNYGNTIARYGVASTPTISLRNLPLVETGAPVSGVGGTQIPNFFFLDRDIDRAYSFVGNDAILVDKITHEGKMKTMFERLSGYKTLNCFSHYDAFANKSYDGMINLAAGEKSRDFGEKLCISELFKRAKVEKELKEVRTNLMEDIFSYSEISKFLFASKATKKKIIQGRLKELARQEEKSMPDYFLIYNPWPDHFAHHYGAFSDEIISATGELNRFDYWLKKMEEAYEEAGVLDRTLFAMAGDHGLTQSEFIVSPEKEVLEKLNAEENLDMNFIKITPDEGEGPKVTNAFSPPSNKGYDVLVASTAGGSFMMEFFKDQESGWTQQPIYSDLTSINIINSSKSVDMVEEISRRLADSLDYLVVRESDCSPSKCSIRLVAYRGEDRRDEIISRVGDKIVYYNVSDSNNDPLDVVLLQLNENSPYRNFTESEKEEKIKFYERCMRHVDIEKSSTWCSEKEWRQYTRLSPKPDSVGQLSKLYHFDHAGTVNLFPQFTVGFNTKLSGRHAGEHFHEKDAFVGFWGKPVQSKSTKLTTALNGSLAPTIYEFLTGSEAREGNNFWGFDSILDQIKQ